MAPSKHDDNQKKPNTHEQILKNMSHELRTPLSGVEHALFLLKKTKLTKEQQSYLEMGDESIQILAKKIDALIALKEIEEIRLNEQVFNLESEMIQLVSFYDARCQLKSIDFYFDFDYDIKHTFFGDIAKIKSVLRHLLDNCLQFTKQGNITLHIKKTDTNQIEFSVKDTGIGIEQSMMHELTKAFFQMDMTDQRSEGGLGLGLTIAQAYVKTLGGSLSIFSEVGKGTTVSFHITLKEQEHLTFMDVKNYHVYLHLNRIQKALITSIGFQENEKDSKDFIFFDDETIKDLERMKKTYGDQKTKTVLLTSFNQRQMKGIDYTIKFPLTREVLIKTLFQTAKDESESDYQPMLSGYALIVDDNRLNRIALASILMKQGIQSKTVESGLLAIEAVKQETFDMILMDVQMPHMDGMEATRRIRALGKAYQNIPIIAVTANAYFNDYDLLKTSQMTDVIFKPIKTESLNPVLRKYLKPSQEITIPENLYVFDENEFMSRFSGSLDIAKEVIETFMIEYPKDMKKIEESIQIKHAEHIIKYVHYFKGSCSYLSAQKMVWLINLMMDHAKHQNLEFMDALYRQLMSETNKLIKELNTFVDKVKNSSI